MIGISDVMSNAKLLGPHFYGSSWNTWRAVLKAMSAERMSAGEIETFRSVAGRDPPTQPVSQAVFVVGRGGGKDSVASLIAVTAAINFSPKGSRLRPGEKAVVMCIACDREQAAIVFNYIRASFEAVPALTKLVRNIGSDTIELTNSVDIEVYSNSYRSVRGRSILCAIFDEVSFWRSENSATPDFEVDGAVAPGLGRVPGSTLVLISSAHKRSGLLYQRWKDCYGKNDPNTLVVRGTTRQFNPTFPAATIVQHLAQDRQRFGAEYLSEWRDDLSTFITRDLLDAAVDHGVLVRPPVDGVVYYCFVDASAGGADSFTAAIAHLEGDRVVLDLLFERQGKIDPYAVAAEIVEIAKQYRCTSCVGDNFAKEWVAGAFTKLGLIYRKSDVVCSDIYLNVLPLFNAGRVRLLDSPRLVTQFCSLERRTLAGGRDQVKHATGDHDDLCNAAAGALTLASRTAYEQQIPMIAPYVVGKDGVVYSDPAANNNDRRAQPPQHYLKSGQPAEPWRDYVNADGYISMNCGGNRWGPV